MNERKENPDKTRLDCLSDPRFVFSFSISAEGRCQLDKPLRADYPNLRNAIDHIRVKEGQIPACVRCGQPVLEIYSEPDGLTTRWNCQHCKTSFLR